MAVDLPDNVLITKLDELVSWCRKNSLWPMPFATACCGIELMATGASRHDLARFGAEVFRFSPRQCDLMIVAGRVVMKMLPVLQRIWHADARAEVVHLDGGLRSTGGVFDTYSVVQGIDRFMPGRHVRARLPAAARATDPVDHRLAGEDPARRDDVRARVRRSRSGRSRSGLQWSESRQCGQRTPMTDATTTIDALKDSASPDLAVQRVSRPDAGGRAGRSRSTRCSRCSRNELGFDMLVDVTCVDYLYYRGAKDRFGLVYLLANTESNERITVRTFVNDPEPDGPVGGAALGRGQLAGARGVGPVRDPLCRAIPTCGGSCCPRSSRPIRCARTIRLQGRGERHNFPGDHAGGELMNASNADAPCLLQPDLRTPMHLAHDEPQEYLWTMNFGPQHPATHTTLAPGAEAGRRAGGGRHARHRLPALRLREARRVLDYNQYVTVTDRMNYVSPMANNVAWHLARREADGHRGAAAVPVHPGDRGRAGADLRPPGVQRGGGARHGGVHVLHLRLQSRARWIYDIFEALCGARFTNSYTRVGGLMHDASAKAIEMIRDFLREDAQGRSTTWSGCLNRNRIFVDRTKGIGVLTQGGGDQPQRQRADRPGQRRAPATCARTSPTWATRTSTSTSAAPRPATATPATWCAWPRCGRA